MVVSVKQKNTALSDRDVSAYTLAEAARYTRLPPATLRSWMLGREYPTTEGVAQFPPLIRPASLRPPLLSFSNLIEAHVLRSLRTEHGVSVKALRNALSFSIDMAN
jgi:lambda repressor-like predicted transcriptional regulator